MKQKDSTPGLMAVPTNGYVPMGTVIAFLLPAGNIPAGWLPCDGSEIPADKYPDLISALNSSTTPKLNGLVLLGTGTGVDLNNLSKDFTLNETGGEYENTLNQLQMPSHQHLGWGGGGTNWGGTTSISTNNKFTGSGKIDSDNRMAGSTYTGGKLSEEALIAMDNGNLTANEPGITQGHNNIQPYYAVNYIIYTGVNG